MSNQMPNLLDVKSTEIRTDKNNRQYNYVVLSGQEQESFVLPTGKVITAIKPVTSSAVIGYEENYLGNQDFAWNLKAGQTVFGAVVTRTVPAYDITGQDGVIRTVNTYKTIVFGDTRDTAAFEAEVRRVFKSAGHNLDYAEAVQIVAETSVTDMKG